MMDMINKQEVLTQVATNLIEDSIKGAWEKVKKIFKEKSEVNDLVKGLPIIPDEYKPIIKLINKKPILPSNEELDENNTCAKIAHMGNDGTQTYNTKYYNLDMIISIGFRVNSKKAIKFRTWANKILKDNKDTLEWIEINEIGCRYDVNVTPRVVKNNEEKDSTPSSIVASKDGKILHINSTSGTELKEINDYVKKGDILISGNIFNGDKVTNQVKAKGLIYAEVWYTVNITIPFKYREYTETGKVINHYYLDIYGTKFTLLGKYDSKNTINTKKLILDKPYLLFKLYKEEKREYEYKEFISITYIPIEYESILT